eukprot:XP_010647477.1 PREDICTED: uncharacterized protein LOC104878599 [Vitis vinifera]
MEKKKKDPKFTSTPASASQELDTNSEHLSKEEQNQSGVAFAAKNAVTSSPSHENASSLSQQYPSIMQWPYTPQHAAEQSLISRPSIPTQAPSPVILSRYQQLPHQQPYPIQPPPHLAQSTTPFWLPQRPGYHFSSTNTPASYQPLTPLGTADANWQVSTLNGGGTSSNNQQQMPGFCYHIGYPYPGFPGPWDPSSWWCQTQQLQPACTYAYPGACSYFSSQPPPLPGCSATVEQHFQRGTIQLPAKLSQKHQQLWESQSAQNVQLWTVIGQLQSELADYKSRLLKLEAEASSAKVTGEEPTSQTIGTALAGQTSKRGRPKKPIPAVDALPSLDESHPRTRGRKPAVLKVQSETRTLNFEKECLNKVEDKGKANHSSATTQQEDDGKMTCAFINSSGDIEIDRSNPMMPPFHSQVHQDIPGVQVSSIGLNTSSDMKTSSDKPEDPKTAFSILYSHVRQIKTEGASGTYIEAATNSNLGWPSNISFEDCGRNVLNMSSQGFYDNGGVIRQVSKVIPGWSFGHEEDASRDLGDAAIGGPGKDVDVEDMEDASSGAEDCSIQR